VKTPRARVLVFLDEHPGLHSWIELETIHLLDADDHKALLALMGDGLVRYVPVIDAVELTPAGRGAAAALRAVAS
jgi:hypothetical protein